jgi:hypothetical protein
MIQPVRPIHFPGAAALNLIRERAYAALDVWAREWVRGWGVDAGRVAVLQVQADIDRTCAKGYEYEQVPGEAGCIWFRRGGSDRTRLGCAVVGPELMSAAEGADDWIDAVIDEATQARNRALCAALMGASTAGLSPAQTTPLPESLFAVGSGVVELSCDALGLHAIADNAVWRGVPPIERTRRQLRPKLTPLDEATRRANARLDVRLGDVEIDLLELVELRSGDVLRLPQRLDRGISVLCEGMPLARATLGATHGRKCVQFLLEQQP